MQPPSLEPISLAVPVLSIPRSDRWQAQQRLQELGIPCHCASDGYLTVEVNSPLALAQVQSVVHLLTATRCDLVDWLETCWRASY